MHVGGTVQGYEYQKMKVISGHIRGCLPRNILCAFHIPKLMFYFILIFIISLDTYEVIHREKNIDYFALQARARKTTSSIILE